MEEKTNPQLKIKDNIVYLTLMLNGMSGEEWIEYFRLKGLSLHGYFKYVLRSKFFVPGEKGSLVEIAVIKGTKFILPRANTNIVQEEAKKNKFEKTSPEIACLLRDFLSNSDLIELGIDRLAIWHDAVPYQDLNLLLGIKVDECFDCNFYFDSPTFNWSVGTGHVFEIKNT